MRTITLINQSTVIPPTDFAAAVAALQVQVSRDFAPVWGVDASVRAGTLAAGEVIYLLDNSDQADALGYHTLDGGDSPVGFVFARTAQADGVPWPTTASHELLEQLMDPWVDAVKLSQWAGRPAGIALEVADPVEGDAYAINGVPVSNFVFPAWFQPWAPRGARLDFLGKLTSPLTLTRGGYVSWTPDLRGWRETMAEKHGRSHGHYGRHYRRHNGRLRPAKG